MVVVLVVVVGGGGGGVILGEVKARPKDIISFSLDYISKSKVQTSNPSSSPISLDTPARPADFMINRVWTNIPYLLQFFISTMCWLFWQTPNRWFGFPEFISFFFLAFPPRRCLPKSSAPFAKQGGMCRNSMGFLIFCRQGMGELGQLGCIGWPNYVPRLLPFCLGCQAFHTWRCLTYGALPISSESTRTAASWRWTGGESYTVDFFSESWMLHFLAGKKAIEEQGKFLLHIHDYVYSGYVCMSPQKEASKFWSHAT